jgi:hypothetical protein
MRKYQIFKAEALNLRRRNVDVLPIFDNIEKRLSVSPCKFLDCFVMTNTKQRHC